MNLIMQKGAINVKADAAAGETTRTARAALNKAATTADAHRSHRVLAKDLWGFWAICSVYALVVKNPKGLTQNETVKEALAP